MHPQQASNQVDPSQLRTSLQLAESEIKLWEFKLATFRQRATKERGFIALLARALLSSDGQTDGVAQSVISDYLQTHKAQTDAEANIMELEVAKIKGRAALMQSALDNLAQSASSPLVKPLPSSRLVVPGAR